MKFDSHYIKLLDGKNMTRHRVIVVTSIVTTLLFCTVGTIFLYQQYTQPIYPNATIYGFGPQISYGRNHYVRTDKFYTDDSSEKVYEFLNNFEQNATLIVGSEGPEPNTRHFLVDSKSFQIGQVNFEGNRIFSTFIEDELTTFVQTITFNVYLKP